MHKLKMNSFKTCLLSAMLIGQMSSGCQSDRTDIAYGDAHTHLTSYGETAIDSLYKYGIRIVRDCGGDTELLKIWRSEISEGKRKGPQIYFSGPILDGRDDEKDPYGRCGVYTTAQARRAVDSLAALGVDFIKTHASLSYECYFEILRTARKNDLKVVSHMPYTVPVWVAADSGLSCVEHAAESFLTAPISAGIVTSAGDSAVLDAINWWESSQGDSIIRRLGELRIYFTPTLFAYKLWSLQGRDQEEISDRLRVYAFLKNLTLRLHNAGVIILAGSDLFDRSWQNEVPGLSLFQELNALEDTGLTKEEAINASTASLISWLDFK